MYSCASLYSHVCPYACVDTYRCTRVYVYIHMCVRMHVCMCGNVRTVHSGCVVSLLIVFSHTSLPWNVEGLFYSLVHWAGWTACWGMEDEEDSNHEGPSGSVSFNDENPEIQSFYDYFDKDGCSMHS